MEVEFKASAAKSFKKLNQETQKLIISKLKYFISQPDPLIFATPLINHEIGEYRFRIGDYRIIFDVQDSIILVLKIGHRRGVYK